MKKKTLSTSCLILALSFYFVFFLNLSFLSQWFSIGQELSFPLWWWGLPLFMVAIFNIFWSLVCWPYIQKTLAIFLICLSSIAHYASLHYGIVFDAQVIASFLETHQAEAMTYIHPHSIFSFLGFAIVPSLIIARVSIRREGIQSLCIARLRIISLSALIAVSIAGLGWKEYSYVFRKHSDIKYKLVPFQYLKACYRYAQSQQTQPIYQPIGTDAFIPNTKSDRKHKKRLLIWVVGETARAQNYQLNGYARATNPYTLKDHVIALRHVASCGTCTAESVPCMFSNLGRENFSTLKAKRQDNVLDILKRVNIQLQWIENDGGCKGVCDRIPTITIDPRLSKDCSHGTCFDETLLHPMKQSIESFNSNQNACIILHIIGSHGPDYYRRYPHAFRQFTPDCRSDHPQSCSEQEIINAYDNTILYTDFILHRIIHQLKNHPKAKQWDSALLYVSDHGESLGEYGLYLHGMPYALAPKQQTHVPLILWFSPSFSGVDLKILRHRAHTQTYSHDYLFHTVLGFFGIKTKTYHPQYDILNTSLS